MAQVAHLQDPNHSRVRSEIRERTTPRSITSRDRRSTGIQYNFQSSPNPTAIITLTANRVMGNDAELEPGD